jgi:predicted oxidoreductase (fatty acid repression mutant protein)
MAYQTPFLQAIKVRRSVLALAKESPISDDRIVMCVNHAIKHAPSPFSVQSCRAIVLFGADHDKLWEFAMEASRKNLPPPVFAQYESKIKGFNDAYGTVSQIYL